MVAIDTRQATTADYHFLHCVGSGHLDLALRKEYLDSLRQVQKDIGFKFIRAHGIFSKGMGIYREYEQDGQSRVVYNFTYLDQVFDAFLDIGIFPLLELGFMPEELASGTNRVFWWQGNITPPKDVQAWTALVTHTLHHLINRYGLELVRQWPIEVWNEPNLTVFWQDADQAAYFKLYAATVAAIKAVDEQLQVGGPVVSGGSDYWLKDFLEYVEAHQLPLDFLSRHAYSSGPVKRHGLLVDQDIMPVSSLLADFKTGRDYLAKYYHKQVPVYVSEFNSSYTPDNPIHDGAFNAAYLALVLSQGSALVDSFSYWTFCDVFEELGIPASFLHGGFGLLTYGQIKKPTYYLYQFFAQLSDQELYKDDTMHVARGKHGDIVIIAWNSAATVKDIDVTLRFGEQQTDMFYQRTVVNETVGNVAQAWIAMGRPRFPSQNQLAQLKELSQPGQSCGVLTVKDQHTSVSLHLAAHEITMVRIQARSSDDTTY
ncbi:xylan 1,4-beta-xylosidase [Schleiferilactobacillus harbinensis]|jgi:xylan 1,4-beta-xylosidase|uniref:GH39 family glycosyl hydrolase n=1 Tax=Schleiferilactobacillus harbinensis TaxID=304207 RepID=UPI0021A692D8|nr:xylan 1,4-beta-xylosidase [Schleiferilactobacillus harbinensis]MCT2908420.1 xylan 1,4-beta-xylosidase [Schleiferilactobacillus harbinensis]